MGSYKTTICTLTCDDESGCAEEFADLVSATNVKVRSAARKAGWTYVPGHSAVGDNRDLCPEHKPAG